MIKVASRVKSKRERDAKSTVRERAQTLFRLSECVLRRPKNYYCISNATQSMFTLRKISIRIVWKMSTFFVFCCSENLKNYGLIVNRTNLNDCVHCSFLRHIITAVRTVVENCRLPTKRRKSVQRSGGVRATCSCDRRRPRGIRIA